VRGARVERPKSSPRRGDGRRSARRRRRLLRGRLPGASRDILGPRMVFSSVTFLFFFLPLVLAAYHLVPRRFRNAVLVIASLAFYTLGAGVIILALLGSVVANFLIGLRLEIAHDAGDGRRARRWLSVGVIVNLLLLGWF